MAPTCRAAVVAAMIGGCAPAVVAQSAAPTSSIAAAPANSAPAPVSTRASVTYRSAFEGYRAYGEQPVGSWRQANDLVLQIGGWQTYAREGQAAESGAPAPAESADMQRPASPPASDQGQSAPPVKAPPANPNAPGAPAPGNHSGHR